MFSEIFQKENGGEWKMSIHRFWHQCDMSWCIKTENISKEFIYLYRKNIQTMIVAKTKHSDDFLKEANAFEISVIITTINK